MIRPKLKLHPGTALAAVALFVALGGTSYAVTGGTQYAANAINGAALQNHTVSGAKLENHTITGTQVNVATFPTVPSAVFAGQASSAVNAANATNATNATTAKNATNATNATHATTATTATTAGTITGTIAGSQVSGPVASATSATTAGTITGMIAGSQVSGPVPSATSASTAATATNATNATNATAVDGDQLINISDWSNSTADSTLAGPLAGLTLAMRCVSGNVDIDATTAVSGASFGLSAVTNAAATSFVKAEGNFNTGTPITATIANPSQVSFSYEQNGEVASGNLTVFDDVGICAAFGVAQYSG